MSARFRLLLAVCGLLALRADAPPTVTVYFYKVKVTFPVTRIVNSGGVNKVETKTLGDNDIINIAQGKALGTSVGKQVLAVVSPEHPENPGAPIPKLVIYDLASKATVGADLATASALDFQVFCPASKGKGYGFGSVALADTGGSAVGKFFPATLQGGGVVGGSANPFDFDPHLAGGFTSFSGRMKFIFTDRQGTPAQFEGLMVSGKLAVSGKTIAISP